MANGLTLPSPAVYLCQGAAGPVFPHELAQQAQAGIGGRPATLAASGPGGAADVVAPHLRQSRYPDNLVARTGAGAADAARQPMRDGRAAAAAAAQEKDSADGEADDGVHDEADAHAASNCGPAAGRADASAKKRQNQRAPTPGTALTGASAIKRERGDEWIAQDGEHSSTPAATSSAETSPGRKRPRRNAARAPAS